MKRKKIFSFSPQFFVVMLLLFLTASCDSFEEREILSPNPSSTLTNSNHSYVWTDEIVNDTLYFKCNQVINFNLGSEEQSLTPVASIKLWKDKDSIYFKSNEDPKPVYKTCTIQKNSSGSSYVLNKLDKIFYFEDGQVIFAEAFYENYVLSTSNGDVTLPYVEISDITFNKSDINPDETATDVFDATLYFNFDWKVVTLTDDGTKEAIIDYKKITSNDAIDELLSTDYNTGYSWIDENSFVLFVNKIENWSLSGQKSEQFNSPVFDFYLNGKENKSIEVDNFDFNQSSNSSQSDVTSSDKDNWKIKQSVFTHKLSYENGVQNFVDEFEYPYFEVSFECDGKSFEFDLGFSFNTTNSIDKNDDTAINTSFANVYILSRQFNADVVTNLTKKNNDTPIDDPDTPEYGKVVDFYATAVFDPASLANGNITKRSVVIRYEKGYLWGVCDYDEFLPQTFTYSTAGYSAFNSVAKEDKNSDYELARGVDVDGGVFWYSENNKVISALDELSCKVMGWKNIVSGNYSVFMDGYSGKYSNNGYTLTITAPDGSKKVFNSK